MEKSQSLEGNLCPGPFSYVIIFQKLYKKLKTGCYDAEDNKLRAYYIC